MRCSCWAAPRPAGPVPPCAHTALLSCRGRPARLAASVNHPWGSLKNVGHDGLFPAPSHSGCPQSWPDCPSLGGVEGQPTSRPSPLMFSRDGNCLAASPPQPWAVDAELASGETLPGDLGACPPHGHGIQSSPSPRTPQLWVLPFLPPEGPSLQPLSPHCPALCTTGPSLLLGKCSCLLILFASLLWVGLGQGAPLL